MHDDKKRLFPTDHFLTLPVSILGEERNFRTSLWCLKRFYEGLKFKLIFILIQLSKMREGRRVNYLLYLPISSHWAVSVPP